MSRPPLPKALVAALRDAFAPEALLNNPADCWVYGYDSSRRTFPSDIKTVNFICTGNVNIHTSLLLDSDAPMRSKQQFHPNGILNPEKMLPLLGKD